MSNLVYSDELAASLAAMEAAIEQARIETCRKSLTAFAEYVMIDESGKQWRVPSHQQEWFALLGDEDIKQLLIIGPRGSAKTTTIAAFILYTVGTNPDVCIKYVCGDNDLAMDKLHFIKTNLVNNPRYRQVFPEIRPLADQGGEWTKHKIFVRRPSGLGLQDATIQAFGVTASGTGGRAHIIIFDDIIDAKSALMQPSLIDKIRDLVENDWLNLLYPGGRAIMIGTFWSFDPPDIYVQYANRPEWTVWMKPACQELPDGEIGEPVLWPEKWPLELLRAKRQQIGEAAFRQQFLLKGAQKRTEFFPEELRQRLVRRDLEMGAGRTQDDTVFIGIDPAASLGGKAAYSAYAVIAVAADGTKTILELWQGHVTPTQLANLIIDLYNKYQPAGIVVENNGYQKALEDLVHAVAGQTMRIPIWGRFTGSQKWSPEVGLPALSAEMMRGEWRLPMAGDHAAPGHQCPSCALLDQMRKFPSKPTDLVMAVWLAWSGANSWGKLGDLPVVGARRQRFVTRYDFTST